MVWEGGAERDRASPNPLALLLLILPLLVLPFLVTVVVLLGVAVTCDDCISDCDDSWDWG